MYVAGAAAEVAGEAGSWTVAKPEITEDTCVSIVKAETIDAVGKKWYESPKRVGWVGAAMSGDGASGYNANLDADGNYICGAFGFNNQGHILTSIGDILAGGDTTLAKMSWPDSTYDMRGSSVSTRWGIVLKGTLNDSDHLRAYPIGGDVTSPLRITLLNHEKKEVIPDSFYFSADGTCFYGNGYKGEGAGDGLNVYKFVIPASGFVDGMTINGTLVASISEEIRGVKGAVVNGTEYLYLKTANSVYIVNPVTGSSEKVWTVEGSNIVRYGDIAVAGDHVYFYNYLNKLIKMYNLDKTTGWIAKNGDEYTGAVKTISASEIGCVSTSSGASGRTTCNMFVTDNEEYMIFLGDASDTDKFNMAVCLVQYCPKYEVIFDAGETATTNFVFAGDSCKAPAAPTVADGYEFKGWVNNETTVQPDDDVTPTADITYTAKIEAATLIATIELDGATAPDGWTAGDGVATKEFTVDSEAFTLPELAKADFEFKGYVEKIDDTYSTETNATVTINKGTTTSKTYKACFEEAAAQPEVKPGEGQTTVEVKANNQTDAEAAGIAAIVAPADVDKKTYQGYFKATAVDAGAGKWTVTVELNPEVVTPEVDDTADTPMAVTDSSVSVAVSNVKAGLWYGLEKSTTLATGAKFNPTGTFTQATAAGQKINLTVDKVATENAAFFKIGVSTVNPMAD